MKTIPRTYCTIVYCLVLLWPAIALGFPADFDGDGISDLLVWRPIGADQGKWFILPSSELCSKVMCNPPTQTCAPYWYGGCVFQWGLQDDIPITGDFDGEKL